MRKRFALLGGLLGVATLAVGTGAMATDQPQARQALPAVSGKAYVANEATGSVSVIDTATDSVAATICLGSDPAIAGTPQPNGPCNAEAQHHAPFYNGHVDTHGLWLTPQADVLLVANRISGTIVAVDTTTNAVLGYLPVGREPHLATVRPGGQEAWAAIRGEDYVEVVKLDRDDLHNAGLRRTERLESVAKLGTVLGPSMVSFTSDGRSAFVAAGKQERVDKFDAASRQVVASKQVVAKFTPFGLVSPDDAELWLVHKGAGSISVLAAGDLSGVVEGKAVGTRPNHVAFVGPFAYVTVGGPVGGEGKLVIVDRATKQVVNQLTGPTWTGEPHGIWPTPNGKLYVGHEAGNRVTVLDVNEPSNALDDVVVTTITDSFLKKPIDIVVAP
jgi:YVTN family beta-propeller protein